ncbi:Soluble aldose sugar dehydrogenase YliI [Aquicella siphonis]|uniref:Soluble aldose sugar dehydrogenase YliI n=1 Tax=Aquicella siphonis TaxID=254247 RepID=A0A5E4PGJ2_9COXI|nr:sorbosone dehydrogenase family protein [Aquicella siphonis]VVC75473.1 Soluble aldose sugar dehydrogenase YliI [Aquicella siphonis]
MLRLLVILIPFFISSLCLANPLPLNSLHLPEGFKIEIYAYPVKDAREMTLASKGIVFVGTRQEGKVYAILPDKKQLYGTKVVTVAENLTMPNGVAFHEGALYVAERDRILKFVNIESQLDHVPHPQIVINRLPDKANHGWRYIAFGPDKKLYMAIGAPCNVCLEQDPRFASIVRMNSDGKDFEVYARGIRNSVGFDWDPVSKDLWFTDNGRDWMGDNLPSDELNHVTQKGMHFGFPYYHGKIPDPDYAGDSLSLHFTGPVLELPAHVAALGMAFYTGKMFPDSYKNQIFIAEHGSWNRTEKAGYQVIVVSLLKDKVVSVRPFITGWESEGKVWGRPVDLLVMPDGALLVSDDHAGVIYRVSYVK